MRGIGQEGIRLLIDPFRIRTGYKDRTAVRGYRIQVIFADPRTPHTGITDAVFDRETTGEEAVGLVALFGRSGGRRSIIGELNLAQVFGFAEAQRDVSVARFDKSKQRRTPSARAGRMQP